MARVTNKLQVTIPKAIADRYGIAPGDEIEWSDAGDAILVQPVRKSPPRQLSADERLSSFDQATQRQRTREASGAATSESTGNGHRGTREELYDRSGPG